MAEVKPLKLVDQGGGVGVLAEFASGDTLPKGALPALQVADVSGLGTAATRTALGSTGGLYSRDSVLGAVSQSAGVPTGTIIERGSNANGEYVRFADGTQICTRKVAFTGSINAPFGAVYNGAVVSAQNYPAAFAGIPSTAMLVESINAGDPWLVGSNSRPATITQWGGFYLLNPISIGSSVTATISLTAIGRWF